MKLTIEPTVDFRAVDGTSCRIWQGVDDHGARVEVMVAELSPEAFNADARYRRHFQYLGSYLPSFAQRRLDLVLGPARHVR